MIATAYVLIKVEAGKGKEVYNELLKLKDIQHIDAVTGPFDLIAALQGTDFNTISQIVLKKVRPIKGIEETVTCNVISFEV
ncbi:Lrp/AsnC ligand binding domain-containing protein [candidate division WOR-3 bacterium]|nr:Lrp/AsnC ligand binding domain-containing protein [candidate division WOR-3 bacterium]